VSEPSEAALHPLDPNRSASFGLEEARSSPLSADATLQWLLRMTRSFRLALWLIAFWTGATGEIALAGAERIHLVVLHTNDLHGQVVARPATWLGRVDPPLAGGLARVAAAIRRERAAVEREGDAVLVLDAGDWFQGTPEGALDDGRPFLQALAAVGYDALCVGNHEFDLGLDVLRDHLAATKLPALLANASEERERFVPLAGTRPSLDFERGGLRILVVGLLTEATPAIAPPARELDFQSPSDALTRVLAAQTKDADLVIALTHQGLEDDRRLAETHPELRLIVGGHSHTFLTEGARVGETLIVQTGSKASAVGRVDLWFDAETHALVKESARILSLHEAPAPEDLDTAVSRACARLEARVGEGMSEVVGELALPLVRSKDRFTSSSAGNWITDCMRAYTGADLAVHNKGGIRADVPAGKVSRRALFDLAPFDNELVTLTLSGREIEALVRRIVQAEVHSGLELSGASVEVRVRGEHAELVRVRVAGEPLDPERRYRVTTSSFLASGGDGYVELARAGNRSTDPIVLRELLEQSLRKQGKVSPPSDSRWRRVD
jgi:2',3'-cyclic-nucleotide 2'-phosphodiesterase (5'-nucleotidase family)